MNWLRCKIASTSLNYLQSRVLQPLALRMKDAGGIYNYGNLLDLFAVAGSAIVMRAPDTSVLSSIAEKFTGDFPSLCLTAASLIFFAGGEAYHQAWKNGFPPKKWANFAGDFLSGAGAIALGIALYALGEPVLAAFSGGMHAAGKFGTCLGVFKKPGELLDHKFVLAGVETTARDVIKDLVLLSRVPALYATGSLIAKNFMDLPFEQAAASSIMPAILMGCYAIWGWGDTKLMFDGSLIKHGQVRVGEELRYMTQTPKAFSFDHSSLTEEQIAQIGMNMQIYWRRAGLAKTASWGIILGSCLWGKDIGDQLQESIGFVPTLCLFLGAAHILARTLAASSRNMKGYTVSREALKQLTGPAKAPMATPN